MGRATTPMATVAAVPAMLSGASTATAVGADPLSFCVALMIAVSCCFATPIGSPRHMLIYGPGGYHFSDFLKVGLPMDIIILAADIFIVSLLFPLV